MGDIDFEELDKAVTSLMGDPVSTKKDEEKSQTETLDIGGSLEPGEVPSYNKITEAAQQIGSEALVTDSEHQASVVNDLDSLTNERVVELSAGVGIIPEKIEPVSSPAAMEQATPPQMVTTPPAPVIPASPPPVVPAPAPAPAPASPVIPQSNGRFMDVVHPSSDMRTPKPSDLLVPERGQPSSRVEQPAQQPSQTPMNPAYKPIPADVTPPAPAPLPAQPVQNTEPTPQSPAASEPAPAQPTGIAGQRSMATPPVYGSGKSPEQLEAELASDKVMQTLDGPMPASPFVQNPVVEKRPLGAQPESSAASQPSTGLNLIDNSPSVSDDKPTDVELPIGGEVQNSPGRDDPQRTLINASDFNRPVTPEEQQLQSIEAVEVGETVSKPLETIQVVESGDTENLKSGGSDDKMITGSAGSASVSGLSGGKIKQKFGMNKIVIIVAIIIVCALLGVGAFFVFGK